MNPHNKRVAATGVVIMEQHRVPVGGRSTKDDRR